MKSKTHRTPNCQRFVIVILMACFSLNSCVTLKKTTYLQENTEMELTKPNTTEAVYRIQSSDNLYIRVITPDPRWSTMFNTLPVNAPTMSVGEHSLDLISYTVRTDGMVDIPYLGLIEVQGKTLEEVKRVLEDELDDYVSDAAITVKLVNNYVSILGEVTNPGRYPIFKENLTIFQALAMAGDIANYGNRYEVKIIRPTVDGPAIHTFDLTKKDIIYSEFYYVLPNDVIYAQPIKGKFFNMSSFPFTIILTTLSTFILYLNYFRTN